MRGILLLTAVLTLLGQQERRWTGVYSNPQYGYTVTIPPGLVCRGAAGGAPAHGCVADVDGGWVAVDGTYCDDADHTQKPNAKLGALPAIETHRREGNRTRRAVKAIRRTAPPICYTVDADCPQDGPCTTAFAQLRRSFRLRKP
jgi:hypothetical protein